MLIVVCFVIVQLILSLIVQIDLIVLRVAFGCDLVFYT